MSLSEGPLFSSDVTGNLKEDSSLCLHLGLSCRPVFLRLCLINYNLPGDPQEPPGDFIRVI